MFPAAGKGERRSLRGSARLSSKMSGKLPRLRALRPRPQHQRRARTEHVADVDDATTPRPEGNLKEAAESHEVEHDAKKGEDTGASGTVSKANEMDEDDNDDELTMTVADADEEDEEETLDGDVDVDVDIDIDVDVDVAVSSEETVDVETNERAPYECKTCEPSKTLPSIRAYFAHLRKEHKYKVSVRARTLLLPDILLEFVLLRVSCSRAFFWSFLFIFSSLSLSLSLSLSFSFFFKHDHF